jgi:hypothetical protein
MMAASDDVDIANLNFKHLLLLLLCRSDFARIRCDREDIRLHAE